MGDLKNKKGQVTIFIIIGLIIVATALLIFAFSPNLRIGTGFDTKNPAGFVQDCVEDDLEELVTLISLQGGDTEPSNFYLHEDEKFNYLCYTTESYVSCKTQIPFLRDHIESEINTQIEEKVNLCFNEMAESFRKKGYDVKQAKGTILTELLPSKILITLLDYKVDIKKTSTESFEKFNILLDNNLYELIGIANNILDWETNIGDADTINYMLIYPDLRIEKLKQTDGTTLYILEDIKQETKFQFASRSLVFPPGI